MDVFKFAKHSKCVLTYPTNHNFGSCWHLIDAQLKKMIPLCLPFWQMNKFRFVVNHTFSPSMTSEVGQNFTLVLMSNLDIISNKIKISLPHEIFQLNWFLFRVEFRFVFRQKYYCDHSHECLWWIEIKLRITRSRFGKILFLHFNN